MVSPCEEGDVEELVAFLFLPVDFFLKEVDQLDGRSITIVVCLREKEGAFKASRGIKGFHRARACTQASSNLLASIFHAGMSSGEPLTQQPTQNK